MNHPSLHQTVHVNLVAAPEWGGVGIPTDGSIVHGLPVPHEAVNIECGQVVGKRVDHDTGVHYVKRCHKRAGHETLPKGSPPHVAVDIRFVACSRPVVHTLRYAPNNIPAGVDQNAVTIPHNCENHLPDTEDVLNRVWER